ncbi:MAG: hypothetical protein AAGD14_05735 [Planctomycetota bacterium]
MRGVLFAVGAALAFGVTAGLAFLAMRGDPEERPPPVVPTAPAEEQPKLAPAPRDQALAIRRHETAQTLIEDLRDVLASNNPAQVHAEVWRVSARLRRSASWMIGAALRNEASPRVRALVVLAAGVHAQDEAAIWLGLDDRDPRVRRATVLALGYRIGGEAEELLGVQVPVGRELDDATAQRLRGIEEREPDETVRAAIAAVLS